MLRSTAFIIISFWSLCAVAADWQVVADTKLGQLKLDKASVTKEGKYTAAVLLYEFKELQRLTAPPNAAFNKRLDEVLVDCASPSLGVHASRFLEDDKLASNFSRKVEEIRFNVPVPDTMALTVVEAVCAAASKTKP
jgi:hypothetical protein